MLPHHCNIQASTLFTFCNLVHHQFINWLSINISANTYLQQLMHWICPHCKIFNHPSFFINIYEFHNIHLPPSINSHKGFTRFKTFIHPLTFVNISTIPKQKESSINYHKLLIKFTTFHLSTSINISWILQHSIHPHFHINISSIP